MKNKVKGAVIAAAASDLQATWQTPQALVGMVELTGQWWLDARKPKKAEVAAHMVNLAWHGLDGLEPKPRLIGHRKS